MFGATARAQGLHPSTDWTPVAGVTKVKAVSLSPSRPERGGRLPAAQQHPEAAGCLSRGGTGQCLWASHGGVARLWTGSWGVLTLVCDGSQRGTIDTRPQPAFPRLFSVTAPKCPKNLQCTPRLPATEKLHLSDVVITSSAFCVLTFPGSATSWREREHPT